VLGFARKDEAREWQGFNMDFCRAVAAAVPGEADKVAFVPVTAASRFPVLLSGKIELLRRNTTLTSLAGYTAPDTDLTITIDRAELEDVMIGAAKLVDKEP
jgi:ABC-type amino acid transport substrate-binding protein